MGDYESVQLVKNEVFVYRIPPLTNARGHKAADWKLDTPDWTGRMRLVSVADKLVLKLEDKSNGQLYAKCPIETYPGVAIEAVTDSSRYFVIRLQNDSGQSAFVGLGFQDRSDSFDLNVALQDHFKFLKKSEEMSKEPTVPALDLSFKEGQTITINIGKKKDSDASAPRPRAAPAAGGGFPLLPPPPGGIPLLPPPPRRQQ
ncbi:ncap-1 [Pristionchus pacificus]|nr:ncap-1 [Pristionchus pacificus]